MVIHPPKEVHAFQAIFSTLSVGLAAECIRFSAAGSPFGRDVDVSGHVWGMLGEFFMLVLPESLPADRVLLRAHMLGVVPDASEYPQGVLHDSCMSSGQETTRRETWSGRALVQPRWPTTMCEIQTCQMAPKHA